MTARKAEIARFLQDTDWVNARQIPLAGDASARRYSRLHHSDGNTAILMDAPRHSSGDIGPFLQIAAFLTAAELSSPRIWHSSAELGLILMEDLGDALFVRAMTERPAEELPLYQAATDVLLHLHRKQPPSGLSVMDNQTLTEMTDLAFSWYSDSGATAYRAFAEPFQSTLDSVLPDPSVLVLRDYHAENLLWLPERDGAARVGLLDFQDALIGHATYDLVSMLQDARRDVPAQIEQATKAYYLEKSGEDPQSFDLGYHLLGLQRNLRILGIFARLCKRDGKPQYVDFIPRVYAHVRRNLDHPELAEIAKILAPALPDPTPDFLNAMRAQCP